MRPQTTKTILDAITRSDEPQQNRSESGNESGSTSETLGEPRPPASFHMPPLTTLRIREQFNHTTSCSSSTSVPLMAAAKRLVKAEDSRMEVSIPAASVGRPSVSGFQPVGSGCQFALNDAVTGPHRTINGTGTVGKSANDMVANTDKSLNGKIANCEPSSGRAS